MINNIHERTFYEHGKIIFKKNEPGHAFYYIDSGTIDMWDKKDGEEVKVFTLGKGEIFGEMALLDGSSRLYTAVAGFEGATLVCISNTYMEKVMAESHPFIKLLIKRLVENMRRLGK